MIRSAWKTWLVHLSGTRQQITLVVLIMWALTVWRGVQVLKSSTEAVAILQAITPVFVATVGAWFAGKWLASNTNGHEEDPKP